MKKYTLFFSCIFIASLFYSCSPIINNNLDAFYKKANLDAMYASESEISNSLVAISPNNPFLQWQGEGEEQRVLMVSWTKSPNNYKEDTKTALNWEEVWATAAPELKHWWTKNKKKVKDVNLRVEQLLGLPPKSGHTHFVELWVKPADMFRPAPDNEITDTTTGLEFPEKIDSTYREWYNGNIIYSYYPLAYPWTRLGYTYDWGNRKLHKGLSEFVIRQNAEVIVKSIQTTAEYFQK